MGAAMTPREILGAALMATPLWAGLALAIAHDGWRALIPFACVMGVMGCCALGIHLLLSE
jgi:hypothetical protein